MPERNDNERSFDHLNTMCKSGSKNNAPKRLKFDIFSVDSFCVLKKCNSRIFNAHNIQIRVALPFKA